AELDGIEPGPSRQQQAQEKPTEMAMRWKQRCGFAKGCRGRLRHRVVQSHRTRVSNDSRPRESTTGRRRDRQKMGLERAPVISRLDNLAATNPRGPMRSTGLWRCKSTQ